MVKQISDRVAVMHNGKIVELADSEELFNNPIHPYTKKLLAAIPIPDPNHESNHDSIVKAEDELVAYKGSEFKEVSPHHWVYC
ncbi:oligopeptide/dipeptide ABC transporter ATP-binding protein [Jeotgalibaca porci]